MGCKERDKASAHTTHKLCVKKKERRRKKKKAKKKKKEKCVDVIRSQAK